jgi:hypothetical protein
LARSRIDKSNISARVSVAGRAGPRWFDQHRPPGSGAARAGAPAFKGRAAPVSYAIDLERDLSAAPATLIEPVGGVGDRTGILSLASVTGLVATVGGEDSYARQDGLKSTSALVGGWLNAHVHS